MCTTGRPPPSSDSCNCRPGHSAALLINGSSSASLACRQERKEAPWSSTFTSKVHSQEANVPGCHRLCCCPTGCRRVQDDRNRGQPCVKAGGEQAGRSQLLVDGGCPGIALCVALRFCRCGIGWQERWRQWRLGNAVGACRSLRGSSEAWR
jgi:hypothetical protein